DYYCQSYDSSLDVLF
nr:immunoglobulin light chain junction region [Macaca mulatta]MOX71767.1 immunoglobulin light chain junction region [Macaca mulatta]MOX72662.1 immunoglobulin light chain junction region [Macaca mulatta]